MQNEALRFRDYFKRCREKMTLTELILNVNKYIQGETVDPGMPCYVTLRSNLNKINRVLKVVFFHCSILKICLLMSSLYFHTGYGQGKTELQLFRAVNNTDSIWEDIN